MPSRCNQAVAVPKSALDEGQDDEDDEDFGQFVREDLNAFNCPNIPTEHVEETPWLKRSSFHHYPQDTDKDKDDAGGKQSQLPLTSNADLGKHHSSRPAPPVPPANNGLGTDQLVPRACSPWNLSTTVSWP